MGLDNKAVLIQLSISMPEFRKIDKGIIQKSAQEFNMKRGSVSATKRLMSSQRLEDLKGLRTTIREWFHDNTLPWGMRGVSLCASTNYLQLRKEYTEYQKLWSNNVGQFEAEYPQLVLEAQTYVGDRYRASDYPSVGELRDRFNLDLAVFPVPSNDFRVEMSDVEKAKLERDVDRRVADAEAAAGKELVNRILEPLSALSTALLDPTAVFKDTKVTNLHHVANLVNRLNFNDDPTISSIKQDIDAKLTGYNIHALRHDPVLRKQKGEEAKSIVEKVNSLINNMNGGTNGIR